MKFLPDVTMWAGPHGPTNHQKQFWGLNWFEIELISEHTQPF